eukprot:6468324-Amphidinium_carterae.1
MRDGLTPGQKGLEKAGEKEIGTQEVQEALKEEERAGHRRASAHLEAGQVLYDRAATVAAHGLNQPRSTWERKPGYPAGESLKSQEDARVPRSQRGRKRECWQRRQVLTFGHELSVRPSTVSHPPMTAEQRQMEKKVRQPWLKESTSDSRTKVTLVPAVGPLKQSSDEGPLAVRTLNAQVKARAGWWTPRQVQATALERLWLSCYDFVAEGIDVARQDWHAYLGHHRIDDHGEVAVLAQELNWERVEPALPPQDCCAVLEAEAICTGSAL